MSKTLRGKGQAYVDGVQGQDRGAQTARAPGVGADVSREKGRQRSGTQAAGERGRCGGSEGITWSARKG